MVAILKIQPGDFHPIKKYISFIGIKIKVMVPPPHVELFEFRTATVWFDKDGILCSVAKNVVLQNLEEAQAVMKDFTEVTRGKKVCILSDSTESAAINKEVRDYLAEVLPDLALAVAIISRSAVGKMVANLFFSIKKQPYPVKMFTDEAEAKAWLKQYL